MFQGSLPQVTVGEWTGAAFRLDMTAPWFMRAVGYLASLSSALAWLAIGMTLAQISLSEATQDKDVWVYTIGKLVMMPAVMLLIMLFFRKINFLALNETAITSIIIMLATPPATVAVSYMLSTLRKKRCLLPMLHLFQPSWRLLRLYFGLLFLLHLKQQLYFNI